MAHVFIGDVSPLGQSPSGALVPLACTAPTAASGVLTSDNTNVSNGDTVTIGAVTYTFVTSLSNSYTQGQVLIGGSADTSLTNLAAAINGSGGSVYYERGPNPKVSSSAVSSHAITITALNTDSSGTLGGLGNSIVTSTTAAHLSFGATTLTNGLAGVLQQSGGGGSAGTATYTGFTIAASQTGHAAIPTTAKRWSLIFQSASGTVSYGNSYQDGVNVLVNGIGPGPAISDNASPATAITVTTDANTVCFVFYSTT